MAQRARRQAPAASACEPKGILSSSCPVRAEPARPRQRPARPLGQVRSDRAKSASLVSSYVALPVCLGSKPREWSRWHASCASVQDRPRSCAGPRWPVAVVLGNDGARSLPPAASSRLVRSARLLSRLETSGPSGAAALLPRFPRSCPAAACGRFASAVSPQLPGSAAMARTMSGPVACT